MPYSNNADLPESVRNALPSEAQTVWRTVFNQTEERHSDESRSAATAWTAVKNGWRKDDDGNWIRKAEGFTPPQAVRNNAKRGLEMRQKYGRGGLDTQEAGRQGIGSGVARARDLAAGKSVSAETIRRMVAFFARHEKNKDSRTDSGEPGAGMIAWLLWGGDAGRRWAESIANRLEKGGDGLADWETEFEIAKTADEQQLVFGWLSVSQDKDGSAIVDKQGDVIPPDELEKAAYDFVLYARRAGEMHKRTEGIGRLVESVIMTVEKQQVMGIPPNTVPVGWWVGFKIDDPGVWAKVKSGEYRAFSIGGSGHREEVSTNAD